MKISMQPQAARRVGLGWGGRRSGTGTIIIFCYTVNVKKVDSEIHCCLNV